MNTSLLTLLLLLLGGGGADLLDNVPTDLFWRDQNIAMTVENMAAALKTDPAGDATDFIPDLGAADPRARLAAVDKIMKLGPGVIPQLRESESSPSAEIAQRSHAIVVELTAVKKKNDVRRLMAIRALGELKDPQGLPILKSLADSSDDFVADYVRSAIAAINGEPRAQPAATQPAQTRPAITSSPDTQPSATQPAVVNVNPDVWLLPAACRAVAQVRPRGHGPIDLRRAAAGLLVRSNQNPQEVIEQMGRMALAVAERVGNIHVNSLTAGISGDIGDQKGFAVLIGSGRFDSRTVAAVAHSEKIPFKVVNGFEVFEPDGESAFFLPSDDRIVLCAAPAGESYPLAEMIAAVQKGEGELKTSQEMSKLIGSIDTTRPVWAVAQITDSFRELPPLQWLQTLTVVGEPTEGALHLVARGQAKDADSAKGATDQITGLAANAATEIRIVEPIIPALKSAEDFFASVKCGSKGNAVGAAADIKDSSTSLFMLPLFVNFGNQHEVIPPPPRPGGLGHGHPDHVGP